MSGRLLALLLVIAGFGVVSALALVDVGYLGVVAPLVHSWGGAQVLADFVILAVLVCGWMIRDARASGIAAWPFVLITVVAGSLGPLLYLVVRELRATTRRPVAA